MNGRVPSANEQVVLSTALVDRMLDLLEEMGLQPGGMKLLSGRQTHAAHQLHTDLMYELTGVSGVVATLRQVIEGKEGI